MDASTLGMRKPNSTRTIAACKSLRPREFNRQTLAMEIEKDEHELFLEKSLPILKSGTFLQVHTRCQEQGVLEFKFKQDKLIKEAEELEYLESTLKRDNRRHEIVEDHQRLHRTNTERLVTIDKNWKKTQVVKKNRKIRDLQYELTLNKIDDLKKTCARNHNDNMQREGVIEFEKIMKRSGLGSDSNDGRLQASYENGEAFLGRLENTAKSQWPSNEECSNFLNQLKSRTEEKRAARYEKERRKRRAAVNNGDEK